MSKILGLLTAVAIFFGLSLATKDYDYRVDTQTGSTIEISYNRVYQSLDQGMANWESMVKAQGLGYSLHSCNRVWRSTLTAIWSCKIYRGEDA